MSVANQPGTHLILDEIDGQLVIEVRGREPKEASPHNGYTQLRQPVKIPNCTLQAINKSLHSGEPPTNMWDENGHI